MKKLKLLISILFFGANVYAQTGQIKLTITNIIEQKGGDVKIGVYNKDGFPIIGKEIMGKNVNVNANKVTIILNDIPVGQFAIAVFQDTNADGKLNTNLFGSPSEPYGFSNNKKGKFGPPDFEEVSFDVIEDKSTTLKIHLE
jgi:uncharacterized protein (DUF2141 family)